ncbi:hypothetical protein [Streptomyces sp. NPDC093094]|uniref:hypothetical protein n=1 Tax=Streptomyces sp. NPDC093094 TaxID=3366026 RepID=UPI0038039A65
MSDQHTAAALAAAALVAAVLIGRAAVLHGVRGRAAHAPRRRRTPGGAAGAAPPPARAAAPFDDVPSAVREAERYVHHCRQLLRTRADPPDRH